MQSAVVVIPIMLLASPAAAAPTPRGQPVAIQCSGAVAAAARGVARSNNLPHGLHPKACFGRMQIYEGANFEFVAVAPVPACAGGKGIDVFGKSVAGPWYSFFARPVCGSRLSIGPRNQWGDWMLTINGRRYHSRGAYYVPAP